MIVNNTFRIEQLPLGNFLTGGVVGTAAATVDIAGNLGIAQTAANQTLTLPAPTITRPGLQTVVANIGTVPFTIYGATIQPSQQAVIGYQGVANGWNTQTAASAVSDPNWTAATAYKVGQIVNYAGQNLICATAHTSTTVAADAANWTFFGVNSILAFTTGVYYFVGAIATVGGDLLIRSTVAHTAGATYQGETANWTELGATSAATAWVAATNYDTGRLATINGQLVQRIATGVSGAAFTLAESALWRFVAPSSIAAWVTGVVYYPGAMTTNGGFLYERTGATAVSLATFVLDAANWSQVGGGASYIPVWPVSTAVIADEIRRYTVGATTFTIRSNTARTTGAVFDATEAGNWTLVAQNRPAVWSTGSIFLTAAELVRAGVGYFTWIGAPGAAAATFDADAANVTPTGDLETTVPVANAAASAASAVADSAQIILFTQTTAGITTTLSSPTVAGSSAAVPRMYWLNSAPTSTKSLTVQAGAVTVILVPGATHQVYWNGTAYVDAAGSGGLTWLPMVTAAAFTGLTKGSVAVVDTTLAAIVQNLPASPTTGDQYGLYLYAPSLNGYANIGLIGAKLGGYTPGGPYHLNPGILAIFTYVNATIGWEIQAMKGEMPRTDVTLVVAASGPIGAANVTVDLYNEFRLGASAASLAFTLPTPTDPATFQITIQNTGGGPFAYTVNGQAIPIGKGMIFWWNTATWVPIGAAATFAAPAAWVGATAYTAGQQAISPSGALIEANAGFTSLATFNLDGGSWTYISTITVSAFAASTYYFAGQRCINNGTEYQRVTAGISLTTFVLDAANWTAIADLSSASSWEMVTQTAHGFATKQAVYWTGTAWALAVASSATTPALGIVTNVIDVNTFIVTFSGKVTLTGHGLTLNNYYWLDQATAGLANITQPVSGYMQELLFVRDANTLQITVGQMFSVALSAATGSTYGDAKSGFQAADHAGWVLLDGRLKSALTATQQAQATLLGFGVNIPNVPVGGVLVKGTLGAAVGSSTITQANLPNVNLVGGAHAHTATDSGHTHNTNINNSTFNGSANGGERYLNNGGSTLNSNITSAFGSTTGNANITVGSSGALSIPLGGSGTPFTPAGVGVNQFVFLGA